jgi:nucleotide-binding universal stress UspA family protein
MRFLLAIDDSSFSEAATQAVMRTRPYDSQVRVLHVLNPFPEAAAQEIGSNEYPDFVAARAKLRERAAEIVARAEEKLRTGGFEVTSSIEEGDPRDVILRHAETWPADLIVLGSHGRRGLDRLLIGSVSDAVARHAPCSVEIVRMMRH